MFLMDVGMVQIIGLPKKKKKLNHQFCLGNSTFACMYIWNYIAQSYLNSILVTGRNEDFEASLERGEYITLPPC